jgi:hypothetical protein
MCPIPNGSRDRAVSPYSTLYTVQTSNMPCGRAIAEAVSRWLPTAAARVQSQVW